MLVGADIRVDRDEELTVAVYKRYCSMRAIVHEPLTGRRHGPASNSLCSLGHSGIVEPESAGLEA
jgi:hypothetical protein